MDPLLPSFRRDLRARAHHLHPVVSIGQHGLTPSVVHEIDVALTAHELIKVRVFSDKREERDALLVRLCDELSCAAVQQIGKLLVLWRPRPPGDAAASTTTPARKMRPLAKAAHKMRPASKPGDKPRPTTGHPASSTALQQRRRRGAAADAPLPAGDQARARMRERKTGTAPAGVPRAAAPRRRRRAP
jgi:RNA-binding protein